MKEEAGLLQTRVPSDVAAAVQGAAEAEGISAAAWVRRAILYAINNKVPTLDAGREPSRRIRHAVTALETLFDSDAYDSTLGLTPRAFTNLNGVLQHFGYRLERNKP